MRTVHVWHEITRFFYKNLLFTLYYSGFCFRCLCFLMALDEISHIV